MMKKLRVIARAIAVVLVVVTLFTDPAFASVANAAEKDAKTDAKTDPIYVSDVKLFYGQTEEYAEKQCEAEGYTFYPVNLQEREKKLLLKVYLGYKTTKDRDEAITDMALLDMKNSHYSEMDLKKYARQNENDLTDMAETVMQLVYNFRTQYRQGNPNAIAAYDSLNVISLEEDSQGALLGDYILKEADTAFFHEFILKGNGMIMSAILGYLSGAAAESGQSGWVERSKTSSVAEEYRHDSGTKNEYDAKYMDDAQVLVDQIEELVETYDTAAELYEEHGETFGYDIPDLRDYQTMMDAAATIPGCRIPEYLGAIGAYSLLDSIEYEGASEVIKSDADLLYADEEEEEAEPEDAETVETEESETEEPEEAETEEPEEETYGEGRSVADLFRDIASAKERELYVQDVYALLAGMSSVQKTVWRLGGLTMFTQTLISHDDYEKKRASILKERRKQLDDRGIKDKKVWLWQGSSRELYNSRVAETSAAIEKALAGEAVLESINEIKRKEFDETAFYLSIASIVWDSISLIDTMLTLFFGTGLSSLLIAGGYAILTLVGTGTGFLAFLGSMAGCLVAGLGYLLAAAAYVGLLYTLYQICEYVTKLQYGEPIEFTEVEYTKIPDTVVHVIEDSNVNYRIWYDTVKSNLTREYIQAMTMEAAERDINDLANYDLPIDVPGDSVKLPKMPVAVPLDLTLGFDNWHKNVDPTKHGDITGYQGLRDKWVNLYTTKSPAAGKPIQVGQVGTQNSFFIKTDEPSAEYEGCRPLKLVGSGLAEDIQAASAQYDFKTEAPGTPTFIHLVTDPDRINTEVQKKKEDKKKSGKDGDSGLYVHNVRLSHADKIEDAKNRLKKDNFDHIIDVNLTPGDGYTYVGYQMGSRDKAVRDIRVSTQSGALSLNFGDGVYTRAGLEDGVGTGSAKDGVSLYCSVSPCTGTPIKRISVETKRQKIGSGAEPVCLFSGGDAVNLSQKFGNNVRADGWKFKTSQSDILSDGLYLYFWPEEEYKAPEGDPEDGSRAPYIAGLSYFMGLDRGGENRTYGSYDEYIQKFAEDYGFELIRNEDGAPAKMMPDGAAEMNPSLKWTKISGTKFNFLWGNEKIEHTHGMYYNQSYTYFHDFCIPPDVAQATLYLGVSYTYNPYRAITGVGGLLAPYTETTHSIRNGMATPAGTLQPSTVCINGNPVAQAGISLGYFNYINMDTAIYTNNEARQKSKLPWMRGISTEVLSRYLLLDGPVNGREPYRRDDLVFVTDPDPGSVDGYVPVCDMRVPGDYEHPMNFALDTENKGSQYLYIYTGKNAGKRVKDAAGDQNVHKKKKYIAAVVCGSGKTEEEAVGNLYQNAAKEWPNLAAGFRDISDAPLLSELDEIYTFDPSKDKQWYDYLLQDKPSRDMRTGETFVTSEACSHRWRYSYPDGRRVDKYVDDNEYMEDYAYIGVIRTDQGAGGKNVVVEKRNEKGNVIDKKGREIIDGKVVDSEGNVIEGEVAIPDTEKLKNINPVHGLIKYYVEDDSEPLYKLQMGGNTACIKAGGPFRSREGTYYLYYSTNTGTASYSAPVTDLEFSTEPFSPGSNCCYSCSASDLVETGIPDDAAGQGGAKKRYSLPSYNSLRMRPDEKLYIHLKYDEADLPYVERIYLGVGDTKRDCILDMLYSTGSQCVSDVNCNYNSYSKKWVAIGYRRTADAKSATKDVLLYSGEDAPNELYATAYKKAGAGSEEVTVKYIRIDHNLKAGGAEKMSLNAGCDGAGLYLYYTEAGRTGTLYYDRECERPFAPIRNFAYGCGDHSPVGIETQNLANMFSGVTAGLQKADTEAFTDMKWEYVMGVDYDAVDNGMIDPDSAYPMGLNHGQLPGIGNDEYHHGDMRIMMFADHGGGTKENDYKIRSKAVPKPGASPEIRKRVAGFMTQN